ncbi:hypothetical protein YYG_01191 [Plasmodium vinckei petteri]|uniref:EF-hand domain-containing protein n=1 Tax=Plasmodium vinckei petteri TaxID=138298 RepID=W7B5E1_PLAVN|nr:hypothetical protein YYG_01191 [Plasmodium vinckei petteri]CAD2108129.1 conserved Plasmodium protein, unknown function [Plasmodium vinckei petteri]
MTDKKINESICSSVGSSILYNMLSCGNEKSKKTLSEIKELKKKSKKIMKNEIKEYEIVHQLINERIETMPDISYNFNDSIKNIINYSHNNLSLSNISDNESCKNIRHKNDFLELFEIDGSASLLNYNNIAGEYSDKSIEDYTFSSKHQSQKLMINSSRLVSDINEGSETKTTSLLPLQEEEQNKNNDGVGKVDNTDIEEGHNINTPTINIPKLNSKMEKHRLSCSYDNKYNITPECLDDLSKNDNINKKNSLNKCDDHNKSYFYSESKNNEIGQGGRIYSQYFSKSKNEQDEKNKQKISRTVNIPIHVMKKDKDNLVKIPSTSFENINYTIIDRCSYITKNVNNSKTIVLKFSKLYIGSDENSMKTLYSLNEKIKNYDKVYACFCIPIGYENVIIDNKGKEGKRGASLTSNIFKEKVDKSESANNQVLKMNLSNCDRSKYRHLTEFYKNKKYIEKRKKIYHSFYIESKQINKDCVDFFYEIYFKVDKEVLKNIEYGSLVICGENVSNIKNDNAKNVKDKDVNLFGYPFSLPNNCEILGFAKIPVMQISNVKIRVKEMGIKSSDSESVCNKPVFLFYTRVSILKVKNGMRNCLTNSTFETIENKEADVKGPNEDCSKGDSDNRKSENYNNLDKLNILSINNNYEQTGKESENVTLQDSEIKEQKNDSNIKEYNNISKIDDEILYIYIDKIVNLSGCSFGNLSICVRLFKDEKYFYKNFSIDSEKKMCILLFSKRELANINEIIFEIWDNSLVREKNILEPEEIEGDCLGIIKTDVTDLKNNKNITYVEKNLELNYKFCNDDINFIFSMIMVRGLKNMYENVMNFSLNYFENVKKCLDVDSGKMSCFTSPEPQDETVSLNQSENLTKTNSENNIDIYEIYREILRRDIRGNEIIETILNKNKTFENDSKFGEKKKEREFTYPLKGSDKMGSNKDIDYFSNLKDGEKHLNNVEGVLYKDENGKSIYINKECIKEELFLLGVNKKIVNLIIDDIENSNYFINENNSKYILKNNFEEYINKIHNKWEKLSNKLFLKNNKNMMLNDVCEYLDSLYIDDDNYLSKDEFFLFFQEVGIVFVDLLIFDELCLLFFDKKKGKINFSLFSLLIIKKGINETKNLLYGYDILVRFFDFLKINNITIEYLENEIFKIMLQNNYYSERVRKYMSAQTMSISPNIQNKDANEKLAIFLKDKDNICSCTSLLFLHSLQFILNKYNNQKFSAYELFFLVKYIMHSQYKYISPDMHVFINEIKGIEKVNITFFLCLYYIYSHQSRDTKNGCLAESTKDDPITCSEINRQFEFWEEEKVITTEKGNNLNHIHDESKNSLGNGQAENMSDHALTLSMLESKQNDYKEVQEYSPITNNNDIHCKLIDDSSQNEKSHNEDTSNSLNFKKRNDTKDVDTVPKWKDTDDESNIIQAYKGEYIMNPQIKFPLKVAKVANRRDIKNGKKNCLIILYSRIVSGFISVEYVGECLQNYYEKSRKDKKKKNFDILYLLDKLGIYTSIDIGINLLKWYEEEINEIEKKANYNSNKIRRVTKLISINNYSTKKHISMINKIIAKYSEDQDVVGNTFSGSVLENFFKLLKERNINIKIFSKNSIFSYTDFYKQIEKLNLDFSKNYIRLLFCNLLSYDLSTFDSINNKLIFFDSIQSFWNNWNKIHFQFCYMTDNNLSDELSCDKTNNFDGLLQDVKHKRKELNLHYKGEDKYEQTKDMLHCHANNQDRIKDYPISFVENKKKRSTSVVKKATKYDYFFLPLYSIFFYFSNNGYLSGEELIKNFFLKIFQFEISYININDYTNKYYTFYDFFELLKESNLLSNYHQNEDIFFRKDFLRLTILVNRMCSKKREKLLTKNIKTDSESNEDEIKFSINFDEIVQKNINTFSSNFKKSLNSIKKNIYKLKTDFSNDSTSLFDAYNEIFDTCRVIKTNTNYKNEDTDSSIILTNNKEDILKDRNKLLLNYFKKCKYTIKYIREYFYLFVLCDKIMSHKKTENSNVHTKGKNKNMIKLSFKNSDSITYQKKLKSHQLEKMKTKMYPKTMRQVNILHNRNDENRYSNIKITDFPFLYEEVFICHKEKQFEKEEYAFMVYPYILLFCDFVKRIISIYKKKNVYSNYIRKLFHFNNYDKPNKKFYFMHNVENIMTRSGSFDLKEWNKIYTIFELLDIKIDEFFLNLCNILEQNGYIITLFNGITIFNCSESTLFDIVSCCNNMKNVSRNSKSHYGIKLHECDNELAIAFEKNEKKKKMDIFIKNTMYYMSFNKLILNDLDENDQEYMHRHIIKNKDYINYMTNIYVRMVFNECISSGLNINKLFQNIKTRNSFINILSKHFNHIFSEFDIDIFTKKYSYVFDMTSIHLSLYNNFIFHKDFLKDMYKQGDYYTSYLKNKLLNFFLKNKHIFSLKRYKEAETREENEKINNDNIIKIRKEEADYLIPSIDLKNILSCHGIFLSWAELYDFFHPLNKYCVIQENGEKENNTSSTQNYKDSLDNSKNNEKLNPYILKAHINFSNLLIIAEKVCTQETKNKDSFSLNNNHKLIDIYSDNEEKILSDQSVCSGNKKGKTFLKQTKDNILQDNVLHKDRDVDIKSKEVHYRNISNTKTSDKKAERKCESDNKMVSYKEDGVLKVKRKFTNLEYNIGNSGNNGYYYNISFNILTLERVLYLLFIKVSNLLIKKNLKYEQIYFGIKNVKEKDIKKKEMKNACSLLLNFNAEELENIIPDDFILYEKDFKKGIFINIHILKEEYNNLFPKVGKKKNTLEIPVDEFISFFDKKSNSVIFSNYNFVYNFSYEWINFMNIKNEYVKRKNCDELIMKFSAYEEANQILDKLQKNKSITFSTELDNTTISNTFGERLSKKKTIELFEKNIKGLKWKKILLPIFEANKFYIHTFRIVLREFTGVRKFVENVDKKCNDMASVINYNENDDQMSKINYSHFKLSYFCCFGMKEIFIDNVFSQDRSEKNNNRGTENNAFFLNYLFEHNFSTINEMDIINLFEKNKNILKLKLLYKDKVISEATLHILEFFSVINNKKKNENKTLCFISNNKDDNDILFLDLDIHYEAKMEESSSSSVNYDTVHGKVGKNCQSNSDIASSSLSILKKDIKKAEKLEPSSITNMLKKENDLVTAEKTKEISNKNKADGIFNYSWEYVLTKNGKHVSPLVNANLKKDKHEQKYKNNKNVKDMIKLEHCEKVPTDTNFVNVSITDLVIPMNFIKFVKNKFYEDKEKGKGKSEDVFVSIYVQIYKKNNNSEFKLLSSSIPSIINSSTSFGNTKLISVSKMDKEKNDQSDSATNINENKILDKTVYSEKDGQKTDGNLSLGKERKSIITNLINKKKGKHFKINMMNKYLDICNIKIKHNEIIEIADLYIEGKIVVRALISFSYHSEDIILGEHFFKIKNMIHQNRNINYCAERLFYPMLESCFISNMEENKETNMLCNNETNNELNDSKDVCTCKDNSKCKENKDLKMCEFCSKNIMGYISYQYEIGKENIFKERSKIIRLMLPNFVKIYFTKKNSEYYENDESDDLLANPIYERMFSDVIKNAKYKKFVNLEMLLNSLENCRYSNYIDYFRQYFSHFINYNNSLYFSLKNVLIILAIKELSCNFIQFVHYFSQDIYKYIFNVSEVGIVQSAYFINCVLKSQNQVTKIKEYENKANKKMEQNENMGESKHDKTIADSFSSDMYVSSDLSFSSKKESEIKKKKEKIGLSENDWCMIHNWKKWLVQYEKKKKKFFFLYLFLNDIISFYKENKNEKKQKQRHAFSLMYDNCINVIKKSPIFKKEDTPNLTNQSVINNKESDVKKENENPSNGNANANIMSKLFDEIKMDDEMHTRDINKDDVDVQNISKFPYFANIKNNVETDMGINENIESRHGLNNLNNLFCESKTNLYKYNNIKNDNLNKWNIFREQINNNDFMRNEKKCKLVKNLNYYTNNNNNDDDGSLKSDKNVNVLKRTNSDSKYKIYLKLKRIKYSFPLINNKKINIYLTFQIVLNNYKLLNKNGIFPYILNSEENNYILNKVQEKSSIFFCDNYFAFKHSSILLLPSISELRSIFTKNDESAYLYDLKFYLKNFSVQICFYKADENTINDLTFNYSEDGNSIQNHLYNASKYLKNKQNKIDLINSQINNIGKYKNMLVSTSYKDEMLIAKSVIPLSILLKKKKIKVHVPLVFSPFVTSHVNKNEIEVILKYETKNEKKYDEKEFEKKYLRHFNSNANYSRHYHNLSNSSNTMQEMDSNNFFDIPYVPRLKNTKVNLTKDRKFDYTKNMNLKNKSKHYIYDETNNLVDVSNIPLMVVPKVPPQIL